jgi:hypothetical protein
VRTEPHRLRAFDLDHELAFEEAFLETVTSARPSDYSIK